MTAKQLFDKHYSRLAWEGLFKALFCGLIVGFFVDTVVAFVLWYLGAKGLWWAIASFVVVTAATTPLFYFKLFKPSVKEVAKRLDALGLEERMITMTEFTEDTSYLATRQREDATVTLKSVDEKRIRFKFPTWLIVSLAVATVLGCGMTTVSGLSDAGIIDNGKDVIDNILPDPPVEYITITYVVSEGEGLIEGDDVQIIEVGESATEVIAVADDGFAFVEWSDGITDPARTDTNVMESITLEAIFAPIGEGEGEGEGEGGGEGQAGQGDEPGKSDQPTEEEGEPNNGANGAYEENNLVKDGQTYYRDLLESGGFYEEAMKWLETAEDIPPELREFIQMYFEILV